AVHEVDMTPDAIETALKEGTIDAAVTFDPHAYHVRRDLGDTAVEWSAQGIQKTSALFYSTRQFIAEHPDVVLRYMRAMQEAEAYLKGNPAGAEDVLERTMGYDPTYVAYIWPHFDFSLGLSQGLLLAMEAEGRWILGNGLTTNAQEPNVLSHI